jgi:prepilin-type processing-associated H-X9-DG protein
VELLVVIGIIALLIGVLLPTVSKARRAGNRAKCLANIRSLALAQGVYASDHRNLLVEAGDGSFDVQGSWIGLLESSGGTPLVRVCPSDASPYFDEPNADFGTPAKRVTSYGINNYVSPTHAPLGTIPLKRVAQVRNASSVIQFVELAETGAYSVADHLHVQDFYSAISPNTTPKRVAKQMPVGRHGGQRDGWDGICNFAFVDGHAESLPLRDAYADPKTNQFIPDVAK